MGAKRQLKRKESRVSEKERLFVARSCAALELSETELRRRLGARQISAVRINTLAGRSARAILRDLKKLTAIEPISWAANSCFIADKSALSQSTLFQNGEIYIQTASSLVPALALAPEPGQRVLDLCAAPGGKSCHIAALSGFWNIVGCSSGCYGVLINY